MSSDDLVGRGFAHYRVLERIGAGGMGVVLLPDETVGDADARRLLLEEGRKAAALNHPCICTIHEVGESDGRVFVAMKRIDGCPLAERIRSPGLPVESVVSHPYWMFLHRDWGLAPLRSCPRYAALMRETGPAP